jgi:outer membrane protein assembly factor BamD
VNRFVRVVTTASALLGLTALFAACHPEFDPKSYPLPGQLFAAGLNEYNKKHWDNAAQAFDQLTHALPARDTMLPLAYYYLGEAQDKGGDHLLAAQSFSRLAESFPEDSLAARALLNGGRAYAQMWRRPELDPEYGQSAVTTLQQLISLYPDSKFIPEAKVQLAHLDNMFAQKDYSTGYHYLKRRAYDSAIIYLKDVIRLHPTAAVTRNAYLKLYDAYKAIKYTADARDICQVMLKNYPNDREVASTCGSASSAAASTHHT